MAKARDDNQGKGQHRRARRTGGQANPEGGETTAGYFRRVLGENPKLLNADSNEETLDRWLQDHPGAKAVPSNVRANLANIKSVLRKRGRTRQARKDAAATGAATLPPRQASQGLELLEEHIDDVLTL